MKVVITRKLPIDVTPILKGLTIDENPTDEVLSQVRLRHLLSDASGVICMLDDKIDRTLIESSPKLRVIANYAVGTDNIDLEAAREHSIIVCNTPNVLTQATAELGFALLIAAARRIAEADRLMRGKLFPTWSSTLLSGSDIGGKVLGIFGMGAIGKTVAKIANAFGMKVIYHNRTVKKKDKGSTASYVEFEELLTKSDYLMITAPLTDETKHRFTIQEFKQMKSTATLINIGRGAIVKEADIVTALKSKIIASAALDVYEFEPLVANDLKNLHNITLTPHIGSSTTETRMAMAKMAADSVASVLKDNNTPANALKLKNID